MDVYPPLKLAAEIALGWLWQVTRAFRVVHNAWGYVIFGLACGAVWYWMTPDAEKLFMSNWRHGLADVVVAIASMVLAARGAAGTSADAKVAPKTDSL